jgi:fructokinase
VTLYGGIETGGTTCSCIIGSGPHDIAAEAHFPTTTPAETIGRVIDFFRGHATEHPVAAIGIGSFGPVDLHRGSPTYGFITTTPKPGWAQVDLCGPVAAALQVPIAFDTDVNAAALGEYLWGAGSLVVGTAGATGAPDPAWATCATATGQAPGTARANDAPGTAVAPDPMRAAAPAGARDPLLYLTVGTGIGLGAIVHGGPLHGLIHPEAGHMLLPHDRSLDPFEGACPFHGDCWEGLASGAAVEKRWGQRGKTLPPDHPAWELEARYLGVGIVNLICCFSPRRVVVGGGVMQQPGLLERVRRETRSAIHGYLQSEPLTGQMDRLIVPPQLGTRSGVLGALALAFRLVDRAAE